ncbi:uncharacterized protein LOC121378781 [Gigantopelta aegis]|uniref:uncharacterized protein LOC121378781 n=1 Tax=Gigantopelta aegis TaxID=1735272 RepID=UPI001B88DD43|nr:uncharacterized protein LOC121378781 [Gigantopelta aegis]
MATSSDSADEKSGMKTNILQQIQKVSKDDICFKILPSIGGLSYQLFSANIMNPRSFRWMFDDRDIVIANTLWFNAHIGIGLYMFGRPHLQKASTQRRILYSVFGSFLFNFGSVLFWATCKSLLIQNPKLRTLFGFGSGFVLLYIGREYLHYIDKSQALL